MRPEYAFPHNWHDASGASLARPGMTLRDYFAAQALIGLMATSTELGIKRLAEGAYAVAEAMMDARTQERER
jgi:hypothetical protein